MQYESLKREAEQQHGIYIYEKPLTGRLMGMYADGVVCIDKNQTSKEKLCKLAEEIGHHLTSSGDILDQTDMRNRRQELRARQWAYECLLPLDRIVQAHHARVAGRYEFSEFLDLTEEFLQAAIDRYTDKYGLSVRADEHHIICFDPLGVVELFT